MFYFIKSLYYIIYPQLQATKNELHSTRECQANRNRALEARMNSMREKWAMRNEQLNAELCTMQSSFKELKEQYKSVFLSQNFSSIYLCIVGILE